MRALVDAGGWVVPAGGISGSEHEGEKAQEVGCDGAGGQNMLTAVVAPERDYGAVLLGVAMQRVEDPADLGVNVADGAVVVSPQSPSPVAGSGRVDGPVPCTFYPNPNKNERASINTNRF